MKDQKTTPTVAEMGCVGCGVIFPVLLTTIFWVAVVAAAVAGAIMLWRHV